MHPTPPPPRETPSWGVSFFLEKVGVWTRRDVSTRTTYTGAEGPAPAGPSAVYGLGCRIGVRGAEDVGVSERRGAVLGGRRPGRIPRVSGRCSVGDVVSVRVDVGTVRGMPRVVPDCHDSTVRCERVVVVAQELVNQRVCTRATGVAGRRAVDIAPGADCARCGVDVRVAYNPLEQAWRRVVRLPRLQEVHVRQVRVFAVRRGRDGWEVRTVARG